MQHICSASAAANVPEIRAQCAQCTSLREQLARQQQANKTTQFQDLELIGSGLWPLLAAGTSSRAAASGSSWTAVRHPLWRHRLTRFPEFHRNSHHTVFAGSHGAVAVLRAAPCCRRRVQVVRGAHGRGPHVLRVRLPQARAAPCNPKDAAPPKSSNKCDRESIRVSKQLSG